MNKIIAVYSKYAQRFIEEYTQLDAATVHSSWSECLPLPPGKALDIGAGSGRDAAWLDHMGYKVTAVEPACRLRELAEIKTPKVTWLDDRLPDLKKVRELQTKFDVILISAVWMHLTSRERELSLGHIVQLLNKQGRLIITLRFGPNLNRERKMYPVSVKELKRQALQHALTFLKSSSSRDFLQRTQVSWEAIVLTHEVNQYG